MWARSQFACTIHDAGKLPYLLRDRSSQHASWAVQISNIGYLLQVHNQSGHDLHYILRLPYFSRRSHSADLTQLGSGSCPVHSSVFARFDSATVCSLLHAHENLTSDRKAD